jgi:hypothetical protein
MLSKLYSWPWACFSLAIQLLFAAGILYLYYIDFGYNNGREFSFSLSFSYSLLMFTGIIGTLAALIGMHVTIGKDNLWLICSKLILVYLPCLFLSVFWFYSCLALLAIF